MKRLKFLEGLVSCTAKLAPLDPVLFQETLTNVVQPCIQHVTQSSSSTFPTDRSLSAHNCKTLIGDNRTNSQDHSDLECIMPPVAVAGICPKCGAFDSSDEESHVSHASLCNAEFTMAESTGMSDNRMSVLGSLCHEELFTKRTEVVQEFSGNTPDNPARPCSNIQFGSVEADASADANDTPLPSHLPNNVVVKLKIPPSIKGSFWSSNTNDTADDDSLYLDSLESQSSKSSLSRSRKTLCVEQGCTLLMATKQIHLSFLRQMMVAEMSNQMAYGLTHRKLN